MERFIKNDLLKRVSAQDWVKPKDMLPWSAQNGHSFIVFYRSRYSYNINEEDKEYLEDMGLDENGWEYSTEMVRWDDRIPQDERMTPLITERTTLLITLYGIGMCGKEKRSLKSWHGKKFLFSQTQGAKQSTLATLVTSVTTVTKSIYKKHFLTNSKINAYGTEIQRCFLSHQFMVVGT